METTPSLTPKLDAFNAMKKQAVANEYVVLPENLIQICVEALIETLPELDEKKVKLLLNCISIMHCLVSYPDRLEIYIEAGRYDKSLPKGSKEFIASTFLGKIVRNEQLTSPR